MKPAFALDFRDDSIGLLHRSGSVWQVVGSVPLDAPDLPEALNYLRSTAVGLSPRGMATKLIIPNDQILYTWVTAPGPDAETRRAQIVTALEGRTPYGVDDLQFDYHEGAHRKGSEVLVAVIAKETLAEAEAFAVEHRFNPLSFVAVPEDESFGGEAWFGPSAYATDLLAPGDVVERDKKAVVTQARSFAAPADPVPVPTPEPEPVPEPVEPEPIPEPIPDPIEVPAAPFEPEPEIEQPIFDDPPVAPTPQEDPIIEDPVIDDPYIEDPQIDAPQIADPVEPEFYAPPQAMIAPLPRGVETINFVQEPEDNRALARALAETLSNALPARAEPAPRPAAPRPDPQPEAAEAPMALDVQPEDEAAVEDEPQGASAIAAALSAQMPGAKMSVAKTSVRVIDPQIPDDLPAAPTDGARAAFASRRQEPAAKAPSIGAAARSLQRPAAAKPIPAAKPARPAIAGAKVEKPAKSALRGLGTLGNLVKSAGKSTPVPAATDAAAAIAAAPKTTAPPRPTASAKRTDLNRGPGGFGTLRAAPVRGKPRYLGLFLTVVLLFLLAMVAAWSSYYVTAWNSGDDAGQADAAIMADEFPDATDEMLADLQDPKAMSVDLSADETDAAAAVLAATDVPTADLPSAVLPAAAPAAVAPSTELATEPVAAPNPTHGTQDEIYLASLDLPPEAPDPLSLLPPAARGDPLPVAQPAPPPFGTVYQFTADGLIRPTPEGIITPEGVMLLAGKPKVLPPVRPDAVTELAIATKSASTALAGTLPLQGAEAAAPVSADLQPASPNMIGAKPKSRPEGLVPPTPAEQGSLAPVPGSRVASLRPQPRPRAVLTAAEQAQQATAAASLAAQPAIDAAVAEAAANAATLSTSPLAVAISRKPAPRPKDMSRAVEAAIAAAARTPEPTKRAAAAAAAISPEDDGEPELASAAPKIPTKASVAKQATFANVLNLSDLNLIGIYGTQNKRYALVRQPNGRYKKVRVGDSIDNGKVVAITASEVRYQKRGKLVALAMPKT